MFPKNIYITLLVALLAFSSCNKIVIKPDPDSTPEKNFEIFWNDLNNGYPYFSEDKIDWQARHDKFRSQITEKTSITQLYTIFTQMLAGFSDGHLSVQYKNDSYSNEKVQDHLGDLIRANSSGDPLFFTQSNVDLINGYTGYDPGHSQYYYGNIVKGYLLNPVTVNGSDGIDPNSNFPVCTYGMINNSNILYVNIMTFGTNFSFENLLQQLTQAYPSSAMILDLRMNQGGRLSIMWDAMSVFLPNEVSEVKYAYYKEKVGPLPDNFGPENYFTIEAKNNLRYTKPVVVLVNKFTISAAEHATMAMREIKKYNKKVKILGDYTFGATSFIVERTLPCGIKYTLVNSKTWDANHVIVEKTGVRPDQTVYLTASGVSSNIDEQIESAINTINNDLF